MRHKMQNPFNKKIADLMGKMDQKVLEAKLNKALEMLKNEPPEELAKKIAKVDKDEILSKMNEFDDNKLKEMNIDKDELKKKISDADLQKLSQLMGNQGDEIMRKVKDIIK